MAVIKIRHKMRLWIKDGLKVRVYILIITSCELTLYDVWSAKGHWCLFVNRWIRVGQRVHWSCKLEILVYSEIAVMKRHLIPMGLIRIDEMIPWRCVKKTVKHGKANDIRWDCIPRNDPSQMF